MTSNSWLDSGRSQWIQKYGDNSTNFADNARSCSYEILWVVECLLVTYRSVLCWCGSHSRSRNFLVEFIPLWEREFCGISCRGGGLQSPGASSYWCGHCYCFFPSFILFYLLWSGWVTWTACGLWNITGKEVPLWVVWRVTKQWNMSPDNGKACRRRDCDWLVVNVAVLPVKLWGWVRVCICIGCSVHRHNGVNRGTL